MSRIDPGLYDYVTDDFLGRAPVDELNAALAKLKALTGPQLAADSKAKRAVRDGIDRIYRELDARAKGGTSVVAGAKPAPEPPKPAAKPAAKPAPKAEAKPAAATEAKPVARAEAKAVPPPPPAAAAAMPAAAATAAVALPEDEEFEEEDDSETYGEAGDFD